MSRRRRRFWNALVVISLLFALVLIAAWVRSRDYADLLYPIATQNHVLALSSFDRRIAVSVGLKSDRRSAMSTLHLPRWGTVRAPLQFEAWGFGWNRYAGWTTLRVPDWFLLCVLLSPAAIATTAWVRDRRRDAEGTCCAGCGYDLRASVGRCPECGRPC